MAKIMLLRVSVFITNYLRQPSQLLVFEKRIERRYLVWRARGTRRAFFVGGLLGIILFNFGTLPLMLTGMVAKAQILQIFFGCQVAVLPGIAVQIVVQRWPSTLAKLDLLLLISFAAVELGGMLENRNLPTELAIYHLFALTLVPVVVSAMFNLRLLLALPTICVTAIIFSVYALERPDFPVGAKIYVPVAMTLSAFCALLAGYRLELNERRNFLINWQDRLRNRQIESANRDLDTLSRTDPLTGLPNRRDFDARILAACQRARESGEGLAALVLDIDHFKLYNDRLGHSQGDVCLCAVASALARAVSGGPRFVGRIGGEEFAAVLPGEGVEAAVAAATRIRTAIEALSLSHPALGDRRIVSVSIGVACLNPSRFESPQSLLRRADAALYRAKKFGRDRAEVDLCVVGKETA